MRTDPATVIAGKRRLTSSSARVGCDRRFSDRATNCKYEKRGIQVMQHQIVKVVKELQFRSPLNRYFFPRYEYNFTPAQLAFLVRALTEVRDVPGKIAEIGCADGRTTLFLNVHMDAEQINREY